MGAANSAAHAVTSTPLFADGNWFITTTVSIAGTEEGSWQVTFRIDTLSALFTASISIFRDGAVNVASGVGEIGATQIEFTGITVPTNVPFVVALRYEAGVLEVLVNGVSRGTAPGIAVPHDVWQDARLVMLTATSAAAATVHRVDFGSL